MATSKSRQLDRKKFFGDPLLVVTICVLTVLLALFILYPLSMLLIESVYETKTVTTEAGETVTTSRLTGEVFGRVMGMNRFRKAFTNTLILGFLVGIGSTLLGLLFAYVDVYVDIRNRFSADCSLSFRSCRWFLRLSC